MTTEPKSRPILMSAPMVIATLAGVKTQTRRVCNPQPDLLIRISGDRMSVVHNKDDSRDEGCDFAEWCDSQANSGISKRGLPGWQRWSDLLAYKIQGFWEEGLRGLVCLSWPCDVKGLLDCIVVPSQCESDKEHSSTSLYGVPRNASASEFAGAALGWHPKKQQTRELGLGYANRELAGSGSSWSRNEGRETSISEVHEHRAREHTLVREDGIVQPKTGRSYFGGGAVINIRDCPFRSLTHLWVRENWREMGSIQRADGKIPTEYPGVGRAVKYAADGDWDGPWRPSIHMPRWASRLTLEITEVRVEKLQSVSEADAICDGAIDIKPTAIPGMMGWWKNGSENVYVSGDAYWQFRELWDSINGTRASCAWKDNPWCWAISYKVVTPALAAMAGGVA